MHVTAYRRPQDFLNATQAYLEQREAVNMLMLGLCFRLRRALPTDDPPPYFITVEDTQGIVIAAVMTPPHNLVVAGDRADCPEECHQVVRDLMARCPQVRGVFGPAPLSQQFARSWTHETGQAHALGVGQRIFALQQVIHPRYSPGAMREATEADLALVEDWLAAFFREVEGAQGPEHARKMAGSAIEERSIFLWDDGGPVSLARKTRPTTNGISIGPVYTPLECRNRGYATSCVARLSQLLLDEGWAFCSLFTDRANPTSNSIYQKIGYTPVCDFDEYRFERPA